MNSLWRACRPVVQRSLLVRCDRAFNYTGSVMPEIPTEGQKPEKTPGFLEYNLKLYPPQSPEEERRPAFVCHWKDNIKYSPKKMWYVACLVRGMSVEEAVKQLTLLDRKGSAFAKETILEAQQLAIEEHNVEFKSNLWVAESFVGKGNVVKGFRRHARARVGRVEYRYCHYFVRLEEGKPPKNYYKIPPDDKQSLLSEWLAQMRHRRVISSL